MPLHSFVDVQRDGLRRLLHEGLNQELADEAGEPVVMSTVGYAATVPTGRVPQGALPMLAVWRLSERYAERTMQRIESVVSWRIDYRTPATPVDLLDARAALLPRVWDTCFHLLRRGKHAFVDGGAQLLYGDDAAGFTELVLDARGPSVDYLIPAIEEAGYLGFNALVTMRHREVEDISSLPAASLETRVYPRGLPADEQATFAAEIHEGE